MRKDHAVRWYALALVVVDALLLGLAFLGAALLRETIDVLPVQPPSAPLHYAAVAGVIIPLLLAILWLRGAYDPRFLLAGPEEYDRVAGACTYGPLLVIGGSYLYGSLPLVSRSWLLFFWLLAVVLVGSGRFAMRRIAQALRARGWFVRRVLIAGASDQGLAIAQQLHAPRAQGIEVLGFLDDYAALGTRVTTWQRDGRRQAPKEFRVLGHPRDAEAIALQRQADLLIAVPAALSWESQESVRVLAETPGVRLDVRLAPTHYDLDAAQLQPAPLGFVPLVRVHPARLLGVDAALRALIDTSLAAVLLVVLAPALAVVVLAGWLRGVQPLFVREQVLGQGGRPITLCLLNPRVCDQLLLRGAPALVGVLLGRLALIGPRPLPLPAEPEFQRWLGLLLSVPPGLSGPWRLVDPALPREERMLADIWWIRNWSVWQHLFVLAQTLHGLERAARAKRPVLRWKATAPPEAAVGRIGEASQGRPA